MDLEEPLVKDSEDPEGSPRQDKTPAPKLRPDPALEWTWNGGECESPFRCSEEESSVLQRSTDGLLKLCSVIKFLAVLEWCLLPVFFIFGVIAAHIAASAPFSTAMQAITYLAMLGIFVAVVRWKFELIEGLPESIVDPTLHQVCEEFNAGIKTPSCLGGKEIPTPWGPIPNKIVAVLTSMPGFLEGPSTMLAIPQAYVAWVALPDAQASWSGSWSHSWVFFWLGYLPLPIWLILLVLGGQALLAKLFFQSIRDAESSIKYTLEAGEKMVYGMVEGFIDPDCESYLTQQGEADKYLIDPHGLDDGVRIVRYDEGGSSLIGRVPWGSAITAKPQVGSSWLLTNVELWNLPLLSRQNEIWKSLSESAGLVNLTAMKSLSNEMMEATQRQAVQRGMLFIYSGDFWVGTAYGRKYRSPAVSGIRVALLTYGRTWLKISLLADTFEDLGQVGRANLLFAILMSLITLAMEIPALYNSAQPASKAIRGDACFVIGDRLHGYFLMLVTFIQLCQLAVRLIGVKWCPSHIISIWGFCYNPAA